MVIQKWFDKIRERNFDKIECKFMTAGGYEVCHVGVLSRTGYRDGEYRVWARLNDESRVMELRINFEETFGYEKEPHDISTRELFRKVAEA